MLANRLIISNLFKITPICSVQTLGMKNFLPPPNFDHIQVPTERQKLRFMEKVPQYPPTTRPPKMQKRLRYMRGPEELHNFLIHKQYGIMATGGGRLKWGHFEMIRLTLGRKLDTSRMFAIWRVDAPWQPVSKKGQGQRMGGGKGAIDHYCTPIKAGRIIIEVAGRLEYKEIEKGLNEIAEKLPFKAMAVSQEILDKMAADEKWREENNLNDYTYKYMVQNNIGGCRRWLSPIDFKHFGQYH